MEDNKIKGLILVKRLTRISLFLGSVAVLYSFFTSGILQEYIFSIALSIIVSSMLLFGFSLVLSMMIEISTTTSKPFKHNSTEKNTYVSS